MGSRCLVDAQKKCEEKKERHERIQGQVCISIRMRSGLCIDGMEWKQEEWILGSVRRWGSRVTNTRETKRLHHQERLMKVKEGYRSMECA